MSYLISLNPMLFKKKNIAHVGSFKHFSVQIFQIRKGKWKWKNLTCAIFLKSMEFKGIKYDIPVCQIHYIYKDIYKDIHILTERPVVLLNAIFYIWDMQRLILNVMFQLKKWRSIERLDAPSNCKCNVNVNVNVNENVNVNVEETSSHYMNIEETSSHYINKYRRNY